MNLRARVLLVGLTLCLIPAEPVRAQSLDESLAGLQAADDTARAGAFYRLLGGHAHAGRSTERLLAAHPADRDRIAVALIDLLERENERIRLDPPIMTEGDAMYHGDLVWAVATLRDPRALRGLLAANVSGNAAANGLVALGDTAVQGVIALLRSSPHWLARAGAAHTLGKMAASDSAGQALSAESMSAIRAALLSAALNDERGRVREMTVLALIHFPDPDVRRVMVELARTDTYSPQYGPVGRYTIREAAQGWLRKHGGL